MSKPALDPQSQAFKGYRPSRAKEGIAENVQAGRPTCPRYLSKEEKQRFRQIVRELEARRAVSKGDGELIALYCTNWSRWRRAMEDVTGRGEIIIHIALDKNGERVEREKKNPYLAVAQESEKTMTGLLDRLGFTPLNRDKVKKTKGEVVKPPAQPGTLAWIIQQQEEAANDGKAN